MVGGSAFILWWRQLPHCRDESMTQRIDSNCGLEGLRAIKTACHVLLLGEGESFAYLRNHDVRKYVRKFMVYWGRLMPLQAYLFMRDSLYRLICVIAS